MKKINLGVINIVIAGILWGFMGVFLNWTKSYGFNALQCTSLRIFTASAVFLVYTLMTDRSLLKIRVRDLPLLIAIGACSITLMSMLYLYAIDTTSLSVAAVLLYTSPIWVMLLSMIFLGEKLTLVKGFAVLCAFLGCYFVAGTKGNGVSVMGFAIGIGAGISYASYSILGTFALKKYSPLTVTTYAFVIGAAMMLLFGDVKGIAEVLKVQQSIQMPLLSILFLGVVTAVLPFLFYTAGLKKVPAPTAAVVVCTEPLTASLLGMLLYNERLNWLGIGLILLAIVVSQWNPRRKGSVK